ncbi:MAG: hypothetical protein IJ700_06510 [Bacteroidaceae bacterium]|nr:hypothetical protein [Bacteroidaceae bacterium]
MKNVQWMSLPLMAAAMMAGVGLSLSMTACGDDPVEETIQNVEDNGGQDGQGGQGGQGGSGNTLTPEQHKQRLIEIGEAFMNSIPESDFEELASLAEHIANKYCSDDDQVDPIADYVEDVYESITGTSMGSVSHGSNTIYNYTRRLFRASQFHAHARWNGSQWVVTEKNTRDTRLECPDQNGRTVVATLTTSGQEKEVYIYDFDEGREDIYDNYGYYTGSSKELAVAYAMVPEKIHAVVTRDGSTLAEVDVTLDLSSMSGTDYNFSSDAFGVQYTVKAAGYEFRNNRIAAKPGQEDGIQSDITILKGGKTLLTMTVRGSAEVQNDTWSHDTADELEIDEDFVRSGKVTVANIDVLGQLQVKAICKDVRGYVDAILDADDARYDESLVKSYVQTANNLVTANFFYDKSDVQQGSFRLDAFFKRDHFDVHPVLVFADGSSYSMIDETYFNEGNFQSLVDLFNRLEEDYEDLGERMEDWGDSTPDYYK